MCRLVWETPGLVSLTRTSTLFHKESVWTPTTILFTFYCCGTYEGEEKINVRVLRENVSSDRKRAERTFASETTR